MRAVLKSGPEPGATVSSDQPEPSVGPQDVLVEIAAASVCGTDKEMFHWTPAAEAFALDFPTVMGHEGAGTVVEVGREVRDLAVGDRVALESHLPCGHCFPCRTGDAHNCANLKILGMHLPGVFAERLAAPQSVCFKLPEGISLDTGALLEPAGVAWHAITRSGLVPAGGLVLVSGCGPVGLVIIQLSLLLGAANVVAVEPNPYRRGLAEKLGATVLDPADDVVARCREISGPRGGFDVGFEVSGAPRTLTMLLESVRREGTVVTIGHPARPTEVDIAAHINKKGVTLRGIFGRRIWDTWEEMALLVSSGRLDLDWLVTHRLPLESLPEAVELLSGEAGKVLLQPSLAATR